MIKLVRVRKTILFLWLAAFWTIAVAPLGAQTSIGGIINKYVKVTAVFPNYVTVTNTTGYSVGDTVLLIQMKGLRISTVINESLYGTSDTRVGRPGYHEFVIIQAVGSPGPNDITLNSPLVNQLNFDPAGSVQLVRVPSYNSARVTSSLTAEAWNPATGTGGVLAFFVGSFLDLQADIDVTGLGFKGGNAETITDLMCGDTPGWSDFFYSSGSGRGGKKGEGPTDFNNVGTPLLPGFAEGRGAHFTGGGGSGGRLGGAGGGGSLAEGGSGYGEEDPCSGIGVGKPGRAWGGSLEDGFLYLGGGGGGGTNYGGGIGTNGANGGGIIIIVADEIRGNGRSILANGAPITAIATGVSSAGGGGGGGSIALAVKNYLGASFGIISASGGKGGDVVDRVAPVKYGAGGGGGGGLVWFSAAAVPSNITVLTAGGSGGDIGTGPSPEAGGNAVPRGSFTVNLTGFLFNSVWSVRSENTTEESCETATPLANPLPNLTGSSPIGGTGIYVYNWQRKVGAGAWADIVPTAVTTADYTAAPGELTAGDIFFRRVVSSGGITDYSAPIKFEILPAISSYQVSIPDSICFSQDPVVINPLIALPVGGGGAGTFLYKWEESPDDITYGNAAGVIDGASYDPPALTATKYYRREVSSGKLYPATCLVTSTPVKLVVMPLISNNNIQLAQTICEGTDFSDLTQAGAPLSGGNLSYSYNWEVSSDNTLFSNAAGTIDGPGYNPDEIALLGAGTRYFRRTVFSGALNQCSDISPSVALNLYNKIDNNLIGSDTTICFSQDPDPLYPTSGDPVGGDGTYTYIWQGSLDNFATAPLVPGGTITNPDYDPAALTATTWFRRVVDSDVCSSTSLPIRIVVLPEIANNNIQGDQDECEGTFFADLTHSGAPLAGGDGSFLYKWQVSNDNVNFADAPGVISSATYNPDEVALLGAGDRFFRRVVYSGPNNTCGDSVNSVRLRLYTSIANNNISADQTICFNTIPAQLNGSVPTGAGGPGSYSYAWEESPDGVGGWVAASGTGVTGGIHWQAPALTAPTFYRRNVVSGPGDICSSVTPVIVAIGINPLPTGAITDASETTCEGTPVNVGLTLTGASPWNVAISNGIVDSTLLFSLSSVTIPRKPIITSNYTLSNIVDANGCIATSKSGLHQVTVHRYPNSNAGLPDDVCGLTYTLTAIPDIGVGAWIYPTGPTITAANAVDSPSHPVDVDTYGTWRFWWRETNVLCKDSASVDITFWEQPTVVDAGMDATLMPFQFETALQAGAVPLGTGTWRLAPGNEGQAVTNPSDPNSNVTGLTFGPNEFIWTIANGVCPVITDNVILIVPTLIIPSGFSPNNDGINDEFEIDIYDGSENELVIMNIKGVEVFRKRNYSSSAGFWDGKDRYGNDVQEGTYYYLFTIRKPTPTKLSGYLIIKRSGG